MSQGSVRVQWVQAGVLELEWLGTVEGGTIEHGEKLCEGLMGPSGRLSTILHNASGVVTYRPSVVAPASRMMTTFKGRGASEFILVSTSSAIRMMATTIGFATGMSFQVVPDRTAALAVLASRAKK